LLAAKSAGIDSVAALRGKSIGVADQSSPAKNFFSILLAKQGLDPEKDVEWRQYPADLLALAIEKGEVQALADNDPRTYIWLKDGKLNEVATNLSGGIRHPYLLRACHSRQLDPRRATGGDGADAGGAGGRRPRRA
jgi:NitT/TauT family transport system substrate-binding protein